MKGLHTISFILLIIGGLNWLLKGMVKWDISELLGGMEHPLARLIYIIVGLAAVYEIASHKTRCKDCEKKDIPPKQEAGSPKPEAM